MTLRPLLAFAGLAALAVPAAALAQPASPDVTWPRDIRSPAERDAFVRRLRMLPQEQQRRLMELLGLDPRIVGGYPVAIVNHPWQVALVRGLASDRLQFCGGSLIAPNLVVTAAHCVDNHIVSRDPSRVDIVGGTGSYISGGERIDVAAIHVHPQWNSATYDYDVAILQLRTTARLARPVAVEPQPLSVGDRPMVTGWGAVSEGGSGSFDLLGVDVPVVDTATCNHLDSYNNAITDRMFCAGEQEGGKDSCQGDSGGPISLGSGGTARLVGIVSWGEGCARRLKYGVYTRISAVADWIRGFSN